MSFESVSAIIRLMRAAYIPVLLLCSVIFAQTTQPTTAPSTQPTKADRSTPLGMCMTFDQTVADLGIEGGMTFYHCTTETQRRYARSELESYVAINKLVRLVEKAHGKEIAHEIRLACGDNDDYSDATINEDGDAAAIQRGDGDAFPLIRINGQWHMSLPDLFEMNDPEKLIVLRLSHENLADRLNGIIDDIKAGKLSTKDEIIARIGSD